MKLALNLFFLLVAAYGVLGLVSPRTVMGFRPNPTDESWMTGGAFYKTPVRTRVTCTCLVTMALLVFGTQVFGTE